MYKIAVMGDTDSIYGFRTLGLDTFPFPMNAEGADAARSKIRELADGGAYAVIYVTEFLADQLSREIDHYRESWLPAIILIPGVSGNTGKGMQAVKKSVEQAVGSDIIFGGAD